MADHIPAEPLEFLRVMDEHFPEEIAVLRSDDNGESWLEVGRTSGPFLTRLEHPCSITEGEDGALLMLIDGYAVPGAARRRWVMALLRSADRGASWETVSVFGDDERDMEEGHLARLPDGRLAPMNSIIMVEANYRFATNLGELTKTPITLSDTAYLRPRRGPWVRRG